MDFLDAHFFGGVSTWNRVRFGRNDSKNEPNAIFEKSRFLRVAMSTNEFTQYLFELGEKWALKAKTNNIALAHDAVMIGRE